MPTGLSARPGILKSAEKTAEHRPWSQYMETTSTPYATRKAARVTRSVPGRATAFLKPFEKDQLHLTSTVNPISQCRRMRADSAPQRSC